MVLDVEETASGTAFAPDYLVQGGETFVLVTDHVGSVRLVVNAATGAIAQRIDYGEFGQITLDTNPGFKPFGYAGGLHDPDTGLVQLGARDYDPRTGRFTTLEPLGFADGGNRYVYAAADPINHIDPTGLAWTDWGIWNYLDPVSDAAAGFGDAISFGATRRIRQALDVDDVVNCSLFYRLGGFAGEMLRDELLGAAALKIAGRAWKGLAGLRAARGRANAQARLRQLAEDPKLGSADRGWIRQEMNSIDRGARDSIRNPPGKDLAHSRGREAAKGYDHIESPSNLQDRDLHRLQHKYDNFGRKNRERP